MTGDIATLGVPTFHTRVEAWECDHNQHWNVRQYMRVFQMAGHVARDMAGVAPAMPFSQLTRFHRELVQTSPVEIRSAILADGAHAGALVHLLSSEGRLAATALEGPALRACDLPRVSADQVGPALPRGLQGGAHVRCDPVATGDFKVIEHGLVQPREADHTGALTVDFLMGRIAAATNARLSQLGFTPEFVRSQQISRMGVEAEGKNIVVRHSFFDTGGRARAASDQSLVTVDMTTRKACALPDFMIGVAEGDGP